MGHRNSNQLVEVNITGFTKKGNGTGVFADETGRIAEVPFTMPGDKVLALAHRKKSGVYASTLAEVVTPSSERVMPKCVHFGSCGGCRWQHLSYQDQLKVKQERIETLFRPLLSPDGIIGAIVPCDPPWQYRNKMEFTFSSDLSGKRFAGLIMDSSRGKVLNLTECHLVNPWFAEALKAARSWWTETTLSAYHPISNKGALRTITLREGLATGDRLVMLTVSGNPDYALNKQQLESFTAFLRDAIEPFTSGSRLSIFLRIQQTAKGMPTNFYEMLLHGPDHLTEELQIQLDQEKEAVRLQFSVSPSAFFQPNTKQAGRLYSIALQLLNIPKQSIVYDLYCGTGTLGICAAGIAKQVIGVEISPESSLDARTNVTNNELGNVTIMTGSVSDVIAKMRQDESFPLPDVVMVDPPRVGLDPVTLQHLIDLKPKKILYISCNPSTQVENIAVLKNAGFEIAAVQPVDQFPHTVHIENIVILTQVAG